MIRGKRSRKRSDDINIGFNKDRFDPRDGEIVELSDNLAAFIEAFLTLQNSISSPELVDATRSVKNRYGQKTIAGINLGKYTRILSEVGLRKSRGQFFSPAVRYFR